MRAVALAVLGLLALACLPGCGADPRPVEHRVEVEPWRLEAQARRSPEESVLAWWSALQARDSDAAIGLLTPAAIRLVDPAETRSVLGLFFLMVVFVFPRGIVDYVRTAALSVASWAGRTTSSPSRSVRNR